jgi:hypothetical protein
MFTSLCLQEGEQMAAEEATGITGISHLTTKQPQKQDALEYPQ